MAPITIKTCLKPKGLTSFHCSIIVRYDLNTIYKNDVSRLKIRITLEDSVTKTPVTLLARNFEDTPSQDLLLPGSILVQLDLGEAMAQEINDSIAVINSRYALFAPPHLEVPDLSSTSGQFTLLVELIRPVAWDTVVHGWNGAKMWLLREWEVMARGERTILVDEQRLNNM